MPWNLNLSPGNALEKFDFVRILSLSVSEVHCNHIHIYKNMKQPLKFGHFALKNWHLCTEIALEKPWKLFLTEKWEPCLRLL